MSILVNTKARESRDRLCTPRYGVEHIILPKVMYGAAGAFFSDLLLRRGECIASLYNEAASDADWNCPFSAADFEVEPELLQIENDVVLAIRVAMPAADERLDCRAVYLCHNKKDGRMLYFTSELAANGKYFLCAWTRELVHLNFGEEEDTDEFVRAVRLFKELILDGGLTGILHSAS